MFIIDRDINVFLFPVSATTSYSDADKIPGESLTFAYRSETLAALDLKKDMLKLDDSTSDVTLICDGEKFLAHKVVLAARSDVFSAMFQHDGTKEAESNQVLIEDTDPKTLERFLQ